MPEFMGAPNFEVIETPESERIAQVVEAAEADLRFHGLPDRFTGPELEGACGKHSQVLSFYARRSRIPAGTYQVHDIHTALAGQDVFKQTFGHGVTIMHPGETPFMGDITFGQFCGGETVKQFNPRDTGVPVEDPFVQQIVRDGFFELNDENLRNYLRVTSCEGANDRTYIDTATVAGMLAVARPCAKIEEPDKDIASGVTYHLPKSCADVGCTRVLPEPTVLTNL